MNKNVISLSILWVVLKIAEFDQQQSLLQTQTGTQNSNLLNHQNNYS